MTTVFADTFYFIALLSPSDEAHRTAVAFTQQFNGPLLTTAWVLTEVADGLTDARARERFVQFYDRMRLRDDHPLWRGTIQSWHRVISAAA